MEEIWVKIINFENYKVSNFGNVKRIESSVMYSNNKIHIHKQRLLKKDIVKGYNRITLSNNNKIKRFLVHRLVGLYFLQNTENKPCINHKNGNKLDNNVTNLEWVTYSENEKHSYKVLGKTNNTQKLSKEAIIDIKTNCKKRTKMNNFTNVYLFENKYNVCKKTILNVLNNKTNVNIKTVSN